MTGKSNHGVSMLITTSGGQSVGFNLEEGMFHPHPIMLSVAGIPSRRAWASVVVFAALLLGCAPAVFAQAAPADAAAAAANAGGSSQVESIVVKIKGDVDEFSRLTQGVRVALPDDFGDRVKKLKDLAVKGRNDDHAAAEFHAARSELVGMLAAAMNETLGQRESVNATVNKLAASIDGAKQEVRALLDRAEGEVRQHRETLSTRQTELRSVSADAGRVVALGKTLPGPVQHRIRLAERHRQNAERAAAMSEVKARVLRQLNARMQAMGKNLTQRMEGLELYYNDLEADRSLLDTIAEMGVAQSEAAVLGVLINAMEEAEKRQSRTRPELAGLLDDLHPDSISPADGLSTRPAGDRNADDVMTIIRANTSGAGGSRPQPVRPDPRSGGRSDGR